jgi:hypothetical protein
VEVINRSLLFTWFLRHFCVVVIILCCRESLWCQCSVRRHLTVVSLGYNCRNFKFLNMYLLHFSVSLKFSFKHSKMDFRGLRVSLLVQNMLNAFFGILKAFRLHKMGGIFLRTKRLLALQKECCSMKLFSLYLLLFCCKKTAIIHPTLYTLKMRRI